MCGKVIGIVLGEEEYRKNDGGIGTRLYVAQVRSIKSIETGDFKVPELKKLAADTAPVAAAPAGYGAASAGYGAGFAELSDDDGELPF